MGIVTEIDSMQAIGCRLELDHPCRGKNLEDAISVRAIIRDLEFLTQLVERENVRNAPGIEINRSVPKIGHLSGLQRPLVAMDPNRSRSRTYVVDVLRLREKVNGRLAVEEDQIFIEWATGRRRSTLGEDGLAGGGGDRLGEEHLSIGSRTMRGNKRLGDLCHHVICEFAVTT